VETVVVTVAVAAAVDVVVVAASPRCAQSGCEGQDTELTIAQEKEWQPVTKLGRLVKAGKIKSMEEMYVHSQPRRQHTASDSD
jgi:hypothetical protein